MNWIDGYHHFSCCSPFLQPLVCLSLKSWLCLTHLEEGVQGGEIMTQRPKIASISAQILWINRNTYNPKRLLRIGSPLYNGNPHVPHFAVLALIYF